MKTKQLLRQIPIFTLFLLAAISSVKAQKTTDGDFKPSGKLWGQVFIDELYKGHSDSLGRGVGQYSNGGATTPATQNYPTNRNELQYRRIYLGYNYDFAPQFSAELLLSSEKDLPGGDLSAAGSFSPFIKYANFRWKGIFKGSDLVVGQMATPAFAGSSEPVWGYRSVEKTIADFHGTNSYDMGISLQGKYKDGNIGYNFLLGNGTKAAPMAVGVPSYKTLYADVYAKFLNKKLIFDLYADYAVTARTASTATTPTFTQSRNMVKLTVGYTTPKISVGAEGFVTMLTNQTIATYKVPVNGAPKDTLSPVATGISLFVRGTIVPEKLGFFARFDAFNPNNKVDSSKYTPTGYTAASNYNDKWFSTEQFITAGLDFTPTKNVHIMPNIWYSGYKAQIITTSLGSKAKDYDLTYRVTFAYTFNK